MAACLLMLSACGRSASNNETVLVFAAASLTDVLEALKPEFEAQHPHTKVVFNFAGSGLLREQILEGAPADVFAAADNAALTPLNDAGLLGDPIAIFAYNRMQIAVPSGNASEVQGLEDLARDDLLVGICAPGVPCGDRAREILSTAKVTPALATEEPNVRALAHKIALGELDAGIVYATDVAAMPDLLSGIDIPDSLNVTASYPITVLASTPNPAGAATFVEFMLSASTGDVLLRYGFELP